MNEVFWIAGTGSVIVFPAWGDDRLESDLQGIRMAGIQMREASESRNFRVAEEGSAVERSKEEEKRDWMIKFGEAD